MPELVGADGWQVGAAAPRRTGVAVAAPGRLLARLTAVVGDMPSVPAGALEFRAATVRVGLGLGWIAIAGILADLLLDPRVDDHSLALALVLAAAAVNAAATMIPWREWLATGRGRLLLDLWSGGLIAFVALLVATSSPSFTLLLFLATPFIAVVQAGWRRPLWLVVNAGVCALAATLVPLPAGPTALRLALVAAVVAAVLLIARALRREAAARTEAAARADLERTLLAEANHRIKNSLQVAGDLLLLSRPDGSEGHAFDDAAARIQSIAVVHRLLTESDGGTVDGAAVLASIARGFDVAIGLDADPLQLQPGDAQKLGIVANELITNALQHGAPPVEVRLVAGPPVRLTVDDAGSGGANAPPGLGLRLVRRMVEDGLRGSFALTKNADGGTRAEITFPKEPE